MRTSAIALVVLAGLGAVAVPAVAGPRKKKPGVSTFTTAVAPMKKSTQADAGESFVLARPGRAAATPAGDAAPIVELRGLSTAQVGAVVKAGRADLEACWLRVPAAQRGATTAVLRFAIDATGAVTSADVAGVPAAARGCIAAAAAGWTFPAADIATDADYAIALR
jgi:hypothetical protein